MTEFEDKVAVITGAASGIGCAIAEGCIQKGMKVVLADIEEAPLYKVEEEFRATGASVVAVKTNVAKESDIDALAKLALDSYGAVHMLFNNAGVGGTDTPVCTTTRVDWQWTLDVNLMSVVYGVKAFVPIMLAQATECHIVNTASLAGLLSYPGLGAYNVSKHGVVSLSETLHHELVQQESKIKVSVLCPGSVSTRIMDSTRNRPADLKNECESSLKSAEDELLEQQWRKSIEAGLSPLKVADCVFEAIRDGRFYILTHPEEKAQIKTRLEDILQDRLPSEPRL